jgi:hypothetical protein
MALTAGSSQYYVSRKINPTRPTIQDISVKNEQKWAERLLDDSIYIFPNPPSAPASPHSDISVPTDFTFSALSEPKSSDNGANQSPLTPLTPLEGVEQLEWPPSDANDILLGIHDRPDRWREVIARRRARGSFESLSNLSTPRLNHHALLMRGKSHSTAQPRLQIPLLSFISSLLSVDDATFHLLSTTSSHSALFPGQNLLSDPSPSGDEGNDELHGVEKLLLRENECHVVKEGCSIASDPSAPYLPFPSHPFVGFWGVVTGFMANGGKVVREVLRSA